MSVAAGEEGKKPAGEQGGGAHINLKVKGQDGNEVFFHIKRSTQLKKLMNAYCDLIASPWINHSLHIISKLPLIHITDPIEDTTA